MTVAGDQRREIEDMFLQSCHYCGYEPPVGCPLNTLDRVDNNSTEYNLDTCVTCCVTCNRLKGTTTLEQFLETAWQEAHSGTCSDTVERCLIDKAYRDLGLGESNAPLFYQEQMCFIARHNGYEF